MSIHVKLSTTLRSSIADYDAMQGLFVKYTHPITTKDIALDLNLPLDEIKVIMVNNKQASFETLLNENDRVAYFPAIGGG